ncbi:nitroreductase family protein [Vandammella animalimorsus]|uniref:nitroreductase family protein n=1 Tax=Vandammella animalimorsus TaxID=2029117 RepID=UPI003B8A74A8
MGLLRRRSSAHAFAESAISDAELRHLAQAASLAPSAFHLQNGRFTAVCSPEAKQALCEAAFRQPKILQAAAVFIISGDLLGYQDLAARLQPVVAAGQMDQATADGWVTFDAMPRLKAAWTVRTRMPQVTARAPPPGYQKCAATPSPAVWCGCGGRSPA